MKIFNSTFENALRLIILLDAFGTPQTLDMLYAVDFITVYGADFDISDTNLNGDNHYKFSEFASRREVVRLALKEMVQEGFIEPLQQRKGILYRLTSDGQAYCSEFESEYANEYAVVAKVAVLKYKEKSEVKIISDITRMSADTLRMENSK